MKRITLCQAVLALALGFSLLASITCDDEDDIIINGDRPHGSMFMPLAVGNWWEYQVTVESKSNPTEKYKVKYEIKETKNYKGRLAYVVTITKDGLPQPDLIACASGDACYLERGGIWALLIADSMKVGAWSLTGLIVDFHLQYRGDGELFRDNENEIKPETWLERYVKSVGLIYYGNNFKEYDATGTGILDWRLVEYELTAYEIKHG